MALPPESSQIQEELKRLANITIAPLEVGAFISAFLWPFELILGFQYFLDHKDDPWMVKSAVALMLFVNALGTTIGISGIYELTVTHWGDYEYILLRQWQLSFYTIDAAVVAVILQIYLILRYWRLSHNIFVTALISMVALTACGACISLAVAFQIFRSLFQVDSLTTYAVVTLTFAAVSDVLIALALIIRLVRFHKETTFTPAKSLLSRLIVLAAETGAITSVWALAILIAFLSNKQSNLSVGFAYPIAHGYALTFLFNLRIRSSLPDLSQHSRSKHTIDATVNPWTGSMFRTKRGEQTLRGEDDGSEVELGTRTPSTRREKKDPWKHQTGGS
ncbi:hypothetical protein BT69DRAFT_1281801 [Atractiella rhizophila]|nr:hypothetical protein BT69DRAFT_1281801 [Atractiella rhizophila]